MKKVILFRYFLLMVVLFNGYKSYTSNNIQATAVQPNIVLIMADDVSPLHFSSYGGAVNTPNIDKLAAEGMRFDRAYCTSAACTPSRFSILTGQYAGRSKGPDFLADVSDSEPYNLGWETHLTPEKQTLHQMLKKAGYYTGYVGKYHLRHLEEEELKQFPQISPDADPYDPKVDRQLRRHQELLVEHIKKDVDADFAASILWQNYGKATPIKQLHQHNLEWKTNGAVEFLKTCSPNQPFFLMLNTTALHGPNMDKSMQNDPHLTPAGRLKEPYKYHPERKTVFERVEASGLPVNTFTAGATWLDDQIGAIVKQLELLELDQNTVIIVTSDHGIEPAKGSIYDQGVKVPFIVKWKGQVKAGTTTDELVQFTDFMPTFARWAGVKPDPKQPIDGIDFSPVLQGGQGREHLFYEFGYTRAVTNGRYKYLAFRLPEQVKQRIAYGQQQIINHIDWPKQVHASITLMYYPHYFDADQLYDLEKDPYEQVNLARDPAYAGVLAEMKGILQNYVSSIGAPFDLNDTEFAETEAYKKVVKQSVNMENVPVWWPKNSKWPPASEKEEAAIMIRNNPKN